MRKRRHILLTDQLRYDARAQIREQVGGELGHHLFLQLVAWRREQIIDMVFDWLRIFEVLGQYWFDEEI